ncbi:unnamed protein product [Caenorhabditis auriculariae]|uniref:Ras modification protein ERF4 n=1 Tax=Caenorhabditis auriculariae TaxID=2777116 RepID=A0A8S1HSL4_9PELO|nr:unnamed protein product [Caenorhabditis auriculariae]
MASKIFFSINKSQERSVGDGTETLLLDTINKILDMICTLASMVAPVSYSLIQEKFLTQQMKDMPKTIESKAYNIRRNIVIHRMFTPQQSSNSRNGADVVLTSERQVIFLNSCRKIFIQRDYSRGLNVSFETEYPTKLTGMISRDVWENTIMRINKIFEDAESVSCTTVFETLLGCITCYCSRLVTKSLYEKKLYELQEFLDRENEDTYHYAGVHILNPMERGLRVIEISLLNTSEEPLLSRPDGGVSPRQGLTTPLAPTTRTM